LFKVLKKKLYKHCSGDVAIPLIQHIDNWITE